MTDISYLVLDVNGPLQNSLTYDVIGAGTAVFENTETASQNGPNFSPGDTFDGVLVVEVGQFAQTATNGATWNLADGTSLGEPDNLEQQFQTAGSDWLQLADGRTIIMLPNSDGLSLINEIEAAGQEVVSITTGNNLESTYGTSFFSISTYAGGRESFPGVCFTRDTMIDTDQGAVAVQDLTVGMMVRTKDNGFQPIRWVGMSPAKDRAVRIKAGAMGNTRDLVVSPRHRMMLDGWQLEMLFDHDHALVTALELVNDDTIVRDEMADVEYYHVMFDKHEIIYAEGAATESFHPDQPSMGSMDAAAREEIFALFPELRDGAKRAEAAPNLSATQAAYVGKNLDAFVN